MSKMSNLSAAQIGISFNIYRKKSAKAIAQLKADPSLQVAYVDVDDRTPFLVNEADECCLVAFDAADGPLSGMKMIMFVYFPWDPLNAYDSFPECPPTMWLMNTTGRYNADVYRSYIGKRPSNHSSMCLSILRKKNLQSSDWKSHYDKESKTWVVPPMDTVFAAVQMMLTGYMVDQDYGAPKGEAVTMEKMASARVSCGNMVTKYNKYFPGGIKNTVLRVIPKRIEATEVKFPEIATPKAYQGATVHSEVFNPSTPHSFVLDVSQVRDYPDMVITVRLGNQANNMKNPNTRNGGKKNPTVGSGVTGQTFVCIEKESLSKKEFRERKKTGVVQVINKAGGQWNYHGVPWSNLKTICFTTQMLKDDSVELTMVGTDDNDVQFVSGLSAIKIIPSYSSILQDRNVHYAIYMKNKSQELMPSIPQMSTGGFGYVQPTAYNEPSMFVDGKYVSGPKPLGAPVDESVAVSMSKLSIEPVPIYASLTLSRDDTTLLHARAVQILGDKASTFKTVIKPGHVTLMYLGGKPHKSKAEFWKNSILPHVGKKFPLKITALYDDGKGMCATVETKAPCDPHQLTHITMMLNKKSPVYSNTMIRTPNAKCTIVPVDALGITFEGTVEAVYGK